MVKLFGPALSLEASGKVGNSMVFSTWKGRAYLRKQTIPKNPNSDLQVAFRQMLTYLGNTWPLLPAAARSGYDNLAARDNISNYNAYIKYNQNRWENFFPPTIWYPAGETGSVATYVAGQPAATGGRSHVRIIHTIDGSKNNNIAIAIFRGATGFTPALANCRAINRANNFGVTYTWDDNKLQPGTYYYNTQLFTDSGLWGSPLGEISAVVT